MGADSPVGGGVRPLNVLHLRDTHEIGGPGKTILETHRAIDPARVRLQLAVFLTKDESGDTPFVRAARDCGMPVHFICGHNQYDPRYISRVAALVRGLGVDIVHAHEVKSDVIALLASPLCRARLVTTLHGWIGNSRKQRTLIRLDKHVVRWFDRVIVVSSPMHREVVAAGVAPGRLRLLHNAIVLENYRRTGRRGFLRERFGRLPEGPVVASLGRLSAEKGHADLVEALAIVARGGHRFTAVLAGDGPERGRLEAQVRRLGLEDAVWFPGYVKDAACLLEEVDLMVLPSHTEGLPNAALEALAMEVPVLATRVGGTPDVVADGETGRLVEPRAPEALASGLVDFLRDPAPWRETARRGHAMVRERFSFDARTRKLEAIYAELMNGTVR